MTYPQRQFLGPTPEEDYSTQRKALFECNLASFGWVDLLYVEYDMSDARVVLCGGWRGPNTRMHPQYAKHPEDHKGLDHTVVAISSPITDIEIYVDWTLRQFDSTAPYPALLTQDEMLELWRDVDL